jgi:hypothetical protein
MYLLCSWYLGLRSRLVCPTYDSLHVLHVSLEIPHSFSPVYYWFVLGLVRCCRVLLLLQDIPKFVCLKRLVILRTSELKYANVVHFFCF